MIQNHRSYPLSWHLLALVLAAMIPFLLSSVVTVDWLIRGEKDEAERRLLEATKTYATMIDQEIDSTIRVLQVVAQAESLRKKDFEGFRSNLIRVLQTQPSWRNIILHSPNGDILLDGLEVNRGRTKRTVEPRSLLELFESKSPTVGTFVKGANQVGREGDYAFAVRVPVFTDKNVSYALSAVISGAVLQDITARSAQEYAEWTRTIIDSAGTVAARSRNARNFVGQKATQSLMKKIDQKSQGLTNEVSLEGKQVLLSYRRIHPFGWVAMIAVPREVLNARVDQAQVFLFLFGILLVATFGGISLLYSRHLARRFRLAAEGAAALVRGESPKFEPSRIREAMRLGTSLEAAAELLRKKQAERDEILVEAQTAKIEAEGANRAKSEFLANISHELRTPLGIICGIMELVSDPGVSEEEKKVLNARLQKNAQNLSGLIDQILDLSKVEANALQLDLQSFSIRDFLHHLELDLQVKSRERGIGLKFEWLGAVPDQIRTDALRLRQILINIIGNAIKFTEGGEVQFLIRYNLARPYNLIEFIVQDTGIGIAVEHQKNLFRPFSQADGSTTRRFGGTGLGLAFSRKLAEAMGGGVELVESQVNQGSVFRIWIQDQADPSLVTQKPSPPNKSQPAVAPLRNMRVLLVDDSEDTRFIVKRFLTQAGAEIIECENGLEALQAISNGNFDCILMDIQMPIMDGTQATNELRKKGFSNPIVALTAHAMKSEKEEALRSGFNAYLTKPVDKARLIQVLSQFKKA